MSGYLIITVAGSSSTFTTPTSVSTPLGNKAPFSVDSLAVLPPTRTVMATYCGDSARMPTSGATATTIASSTVI